MNYNIEEIFDEYLNELYGQVNICGIEYDAAYAFKRVDQIAYEVELSDWIAEQEENED